MFKQYASRGMCYCFRQSSRAGRKNNPDGMAEWCSFKYQTFILELDCVSPPSVWVTRWHFLTYDQHTLKRRESCRQCLDRFCFVEKLSAIGVAAAGDEKGWLGLLKA